MRTSAIRTGDRKGESGGGVEGRAASSSTHATHSRRAAGLSCAAACSGIKGVAIKTAKRSTDVGGGSSRAVQMIPVGGRRPASLRGGVLRVLQGGVHVSPSCLTTSARAEDAEQQCGTYRNVSEDDSPVLLVRNRAEAGTLE